MSCIIFLILHCNPCSLNSTHFLKCILSCIGYVHWRNIFMMIYWPVQIQCIVLIQLAHLRITHIFECFIIFLFFLDLFLNRIRIDNVSSPTNCYHAFIIIIKSGNMLIMWVIGSLNSIYSILDHGRIINHITAYNTYVLLWCWAVLSVHIYQRLLRNTLQVAFLLSLDFSVVVWRRLIHL